MCCRLVSDAVPTKFNVPNLPPQLSSQRHLLHRSVIEPVTETLQSADVLSSHVPSTSAVSVADSDHIPQSYLIFVIKYSAN